MAKIKKLTHEENKIYKQRNKIEHIFAHLKEKQKLNQRYEKNIENYIKNYMGFIYIFLCLNVLERLN